MATKSFTTEFKFNSKSGEKLINAIENSRRVDHIINQPVHTITDKEKIDDLMKSFLNEE